MVELAEASPLAPPFPAAADESGEPPANIRREAPRGIAVAASTFVLIVSLAAGAWWFASAGRQTGLGTSVAGPQPTTIETVAAQAAVVAEDGTVLRGLLWSGDEIGIVVAPGYSNDAADARQVAQSLALSGHTVLFYNLRGQRPSGGLSTPSELPGDLRAAVADLRTRGVDQVFVVGYRQSAAAAVILSAEPSGLAGVAAVFAYERYDGLEAMQAAASSTSSLLFIGAEGSNGNAQSAEILAEANGESQAYILSARPPAALSSDHFSPKVVRAVLEFVATGS